MARPTTAVCLQRLRADPDGRFSLDLERGPAPDPEVGPRLRGGRRPPRGPRVGRAGGDAVADHRGGGQDRPLLARLLRQRLRRPHRPTWPIVSEELCWGDAGIALAIFGTTLGGRRASSPTARPSRSPSGCRSASARRRRSQLGAFCVSEPDAGHRRQLAAHARRLRRGERRVGAQRHQDVDHQRRHRRRARGRRVGRARAPGRGQASFVVPPGTPGLRRARSSRSTASAPATPPRSSSTTCACPAAACSAARRSSTSASRVRVRARAVACRPR